MKLLKNILLGSLLLFVVLFVVLPTVLTFLHQIQIVGDTDGVHLTYKEDLYRETDEPLTGRVGRYLGLVEMRLLHSDFKLYALPDMPGCILMKMGTDNVIFRLEEP